MTSKTFTSGTVIDSAWLNDVNTTTYTTVPALNTSVTNKATNGANTDITSLSGLTGSFGWKTGGGGTVVQTTNKSTGVTLGKSAGVIQTSNAALAAGATVSFLLTCFCAPNDICLVAIQNGTPSAYNVWASNNSNGTNSQTIYIKNISGGSLSEALNISFAIITVSAT